MGSGSFNALLEKPEDFDAWFTPQALMRELAPLIGGLEKAARETEARLRHGLLAAIAGSGHWREGGREVNRILVILQPPIWRSAVGISNPYDDFWDSGRLVVHERGDGARSFAREYTFFDVRFYPHMVAHIPAIKIARAAPNPPSAIHTPPEQPGPSIAMQSPRKGPPVSNDEVKAWHRALTKSDKALGLRTLWDKAKSEVGPGVLRKQIEPFVAGRRTGPKGPRP